MTNKEDLKTLLEYFYYQGKTPIIPKEQVEFILNNLEKDLEVLEIIKKKCLTNCNLALVKDNFHYENYCKEFEYFLNKYNESPNGFEITKDDLLTQQEFDLIKEWLDNVES